MLYLVGLGMDENDISLKAVEALKKCHSVFCEFYTGIWNGNTENIEKISGKGIRQLKREDVESDFLVNEAKNKDVALLVPGDPLAATTHFQLLLDAKTAKVKAEVIHAPSIFTAIAETGLQLYKFGRTTTLVSSSNAASQYDVVRENRKAGLHTLVLLDIGMTLDEGVKALTENKAVAGDEEMVVCSNLGTEKAEIKYSSAENIEMGDVPAVIIVPGNLNFKEEEALALWK